MDNDSATARPAVPGAAESLKRQHPGDVHAGRLAHHYGWVLRRMLLRYSERGLDASDIEDAVGDVCLALLRRGRFVDDRAWLIAAASNRCRSVYDERARRARVCSDALETAEFGRVDQEPDERPSELVQDAVQRLDEFQREVIVAHYFDGASLLEIARRSGATRKRVRWACECALKRLRVELSSSGAELADGCDVPTLRARRDSTHALSRR